VIGLKSFIFASLFLSFSHGATVGDVIINSAKATCCHSGSSTSFIVISNEVKTVVVGTKPIIEFMAYTPASPTNIMLGVSQYLDSGGLWQNSPLPLMSNGQTLSTTTPEPLGVTTQYANNDIAIISLKDIDRNIDPNVRESIEVTVTSLAGDSETIRLVETTQNSGTFTAYLQLTSSASPSANGTLFVQSGDIISGKYLDQGGVFETISAIIVSTVNKDLWVEKSVNKSIVGIGDSVLYTMRVYNESSSVATNVKLTDLMPSGLKYQNGTMKLNGSIVTPMQLSDGLEITLNIPTIASKSIAEITLVATIGAVGTKKELINQAWATSSTNDKTNIATATLLLKEELYRDKSIILGQVYDSAFKNYKKTHGVGGVRIYLENGTFVVTDKNGKYHFEGIEVGTHVIQVDEEMLPNGYEMGVCQENARFGNRSFSEFVEVNQGSLKRVDFCLNKKIVSVVDTNSTNIEPKTPYAIPTTEEKMPIYNSSDLKSQTTEILWPKADFVPSIPSTNLSIRHPKMHRAEVWLNGIKVSMLNFDGKTTDSNSNMVIDRYKGVDLLNDANSIEIKLFDASDKHYDTLNRDVFVASRAIKAIYMPKLSNPLADGINPCVIAVKLLDSSNKPLRAGMNGSFSVNTPYRTMSDLEQLKNNPLATVESSSRYTVGADGVAYIKIAPTTQTGELLMSFPFEVKTEVIKAWLKPGQRKWIMVGFTEGTVGYNTIKSHQENESKNETITEGRVSFFAKGTIKANWLLSMAYDSGKDTKNMRYFGEIDPNSYYTIYNDDTIQGYEASSRKKLYIKIESDKFNVLFGDFNTDLTTTQLTQYSRTFTGLKSEYHGENFEGKAFVAYTDQAFKRDEIRGDGTSGFYYLKSTPVIINSEKITIEVRDRYRSEIIISRDELVRYKDYDIDYSLGRIFFKQPIYSVDDNFNPRYIVASYEIQGDGSKHYTYGGRGAVKLKDGDIEIGASGVSEDMGTTNNKMAGLDTTIRITPFTTLKAEIATTKTTKDGVTQAGGAKLAEIEHLSNGLYLRGYYREQDSSYGLGQLSQTLGGTRKIGLDASKTFANRLSLRGIVYRDTDTATSKDQDTAEIKAQIDETIWSAYAGYRYANATDTTAVNQILFGGSYSLFEQRLRLTASHDRALGVDENELFPTKTTLGINYALNSSVDVFGNYEWINSDKKKIELGRVGTRVRPWSGMVVENSTLSEFENDTNRLYNTTGFLQSYQLTKRIWLNGGYEKGLLLDGNATKINDEFDAYRIGGAYKGDNFTATLNGEYRDGTIENKRNITTGIYTQPNDDVGIAFSTLYGHTYDDINTTKYINSSLALVYRPQDTKWIVLDKLEYAHEENNKAGEYKTQKLINNLQANYTPYDDFELSLQYGTKYVFDKIDEFEFDGWVHLAGVDARYDITKKIDIGVQTSMLFANSNSDIGIGAYVGYNVFDAAWLTIGYNYSGFRDSDFNLQTYRNDGFYAKLRMRFDQKTLAETAKALTW
jgi:uncharacterized repeat protein (TIGR01451 family)